MNDKQLHEALVGLHSIDNGRSETFLSISGPMDDNQTVDPILNNTPALVLKSKEVSFKSFRPSQWPRLAANYGRGYCFRIHSSFFCLSG